MLIPTDKVAAWNLYLHLFN